jgi:hypothetical protein
MNKSIELLRQLAKNPYYTLTSEEQLQLAQAESQSNDGDVTVPKVQSSKGSATVKQIGKLNKHSGDPVSPNSAELRTTNEVKPTKNADTTEVL